MLLKYISKLVLFVKSKFIRLKNIILNFNYIKYILNCYNCITKKLLIPGLVYIRNLFIIFVLDCLIIDDEPL